jgi:hypothetical protein
MHEIARRLAGSGVDVPPLESLDLVDGVTAAGFGSSWREALDWWRRLNAAADRTGCRPVLIPSADEVKPIVEQGTPAERLAAVDELDPRAVVSPRGSWAELDSEAQAEYLDRWPAEAVEGAAEDGAAEERMVEERPRRTTEVIVALLVAEHAWQIPTMLSFGDWNTCPAPAVHGVVLRHWYQRYGAELVGLTHDGMELALDRPPRTRNDAMALAYDYATYCLDGMGLYDADDLPDLAACLIDADVLRLWWD